MPHFAVCWHKKKLEQPDGYGSAHIRSMGVRLNGNSIFSIGLYSGIADKITRIDSRFSPIAISPQVLGQHNMFAIKTPP